MQTVTETFVQRAQAAVRQVCCRLFMSFDKTFDADVAFFALDESLLDGPDLLAPPDSDIVQEWDKYAYTDYTNRLISAEWSRQDELPSSVSLAMADIVLDNHDGFFTPGSGSIVADDVLPRRPLRLYAGFGGEAVPVFVGLTEKMPSLDKKAGTASFHCIDFLDSIFNRPLDESVLLLDVRTDEALDALFQAVGLLSAQYELDQAVNIVPVVIFDKGVKLGDAVRDLMEAEAGRLYMDELGIIRFKNRLTPAPDVVYAFDAANTIEHEGSTADGIINVVEGKGKPRLVQDEQPVWQLATNKLVPAGGEVEIWADFSDPVTTADTPTVGTTAGTSYVVAREEDNTSSSEVTSGVTVSSPTLFNRSYKFTVENSNGFPVYVTEAEIWGTPVKVVDEVYIREQDDTSVGKYDERPVVIESDYIQSNEAARSVALAILHLFAEYGATFTAEVKGTPALQLGDRVTMGVGLAGTYALTRIEGAIRDNRLIQRLRGTQMTPMDFFILDTSILDGPDVLAP